MATVIELGGGAFIAGDPPETLRFGEHWCYMCLGDGLGYGDDGDLGICEACWGMCTEACFGCDEHPFVGPVRLLQ